GIYPSYVVSSFSPIQSMKSKSLVVDKGQRGTWIRKLLISFQFIFSQLLIVCTLAVVSQISFMLDKDLGFAKDGIVHLSVPQFESPEKVDLLVEELEKKSFVSYISKQQRPPASNGYSTSTMEYVKDTTTVNASVHRKWGDENYLSLYEIELIAGRNFRKSETIQETVISETYARELGFEDFNKAIGVVLKSGEQKHEVVGVMKDFHFQPLRFSIEPIMVNYTDENARTIGMRLNSSDIQRSINEILGIWDSIYPDSPMNMSFMDETIERFYKTEKQTSKLASTATFIAIFISSLGLFGLISFVITNRSKEVGVRKVLGATAFQISSIISREFIVLVAVSFVIATPISYYLISNWMEDYSYRVNISWWIYLLGGFFSMFIALSTVGVKVWKAATASPIDSLRYE
ncbi:MAG: FtsX-like permease family protein, partial [Bacteroidota bacterium]